MSEIKEIYKLYNLQIPDNYLGAQEKHVCKIGNDTGIFKLPMRYGSKDHIVEVINYLVASVLEIPCSLAEVIITSKGIGVFSRFEIKENETFEHFGVILNKTHINAVDFVKYIINSTGMSRLLYGAIQMLILDYLLGQLDRHLLNVAIIQDVENNICICPLYDNGISLYSIYADDIAIEFLNSYRYDGRMGCDEDVLRAINIGLDAIGIGVSNLVRIGKIDRNTLNKVIQSADKFKQISKTRKSAMVNFSMNQLKNLRSI